MKILQINSGHYRRGGADVVYLNTTELLRSKGHEVICFSMKDEKNLPDADETFFAESMDLRQASTLQKIKSVPAFVHNRDAAHKMEQLLQHHQPDVAHIHIFLGKLTSSILPVLRKRKIPVIVTVHDYRLICPAYLFLDGQNRVCEKCKGGFYLNCTLKRCSEGSFFQSLILTADAYYRKYRINPVKYVDRFIFVSQFIQHKHQEFNAGYSDKSALLYNFVPGLEKIAPVHTKGGYFLFYGRLSREKGVETLIRAAQEAGIPLKIVGTGSLSEKYKNSRFANIEFLGHRTGEDLWNLVKQASFVVVPSEWYENNPLTILEAYSLGKPVIGSAIGGIPEIIRDGHTGYLFPAGDEVALTTRLKQAAALSDEAYTHLSHQARQFANENFEPEKNYQTLIGIYQSVIHNYNLNQN